MTDTEREKLIDLYFQIGLAEPDLARRRAAMLRMAELIAERSPEQQRATKAGRT